MKNNKKQNITIIGSGLAGSFLAILLANRGYTVTVYEKFSFKEIADTNSKRSYNITFVAYGIHMLKEAKLWDAVYPHLRPLKGVSTRLSKYSKPIFTPSYDKENQYYAISRASLLEVMIEQLKKHPKVTINYNTELVSIDRYEKTITVRDVKTQKIQTVPSDVVMGADGVNSLVRPLLQQGQDTHHSQEYSAGGYKQFAISKEEVNSLQMRGDISYTWSAEGKFILAFPNFDGSLAALLIYPKNKEAFASLQTKKAIQKLIDQDFPYLSSLGNSIAEQLLDNPVGGFVTVHTDPWYYKDFITIVGDAAHGFYPFFGQGTSAAFGDGMQLAKLLDQYGPDWEKIFPLYQQARKKHMDALGELSKEGLTRYARNKRADFDAIYDKLEFVGHTLFPQLVHPPTLIPVVNNPERTADFVENSTKQRKRANRIGIPLAIAALMGLIKIYEKIEKIKAS